MEIDEATPRVVHALRLIRRAPGLTLVPSLAGGTVFEDSAGKGRATTSDMVVDTGAIAGINGDYFFPNGDLVGLMVRNGVLISSTWPNRSVFAWSNDRSAVGIPTYTGRIYLSSGLEMPVDGVNKECGPNEIVLNAPEAGLALAKGRAMAAVLTPSQRLQPNGSFEATVEYLVPENLKIPLPEDRWVLVGTGSRYDEVVRLRPRDKIRVEISVAGFDWKVFQQAVGGGPILLRQGQPVQAWILEGFADSFGMRRHPRTAIGITADGDVWLVAVDGRQTMSAGATLPEMSQILKGFGCTDAINLDGGGSTALNLFGLTMNRPSDGVERPVGNGLMVVPKSNLTSKPIALRLEVTGAEARVVLADGSFLPNVQVYWTSAGDAWIDQGGTLRWLKPGKATVTAYTNGQVLTAEVVSEPPAPPPSRQTPGDGGG